jgi:hypothetical protein
MPGSLTRSVASAPAPGAARGPGVRPGQAAHPQAASRAAPKPVPGPEAGPEGGFVRFLRMNLANAPRGFVRNPQAAEFQPAHAARGGAACA